MSKIAQLEHRMMMELIDYRLCLTKIMHRFEKWFGKAKQPINDHHLKKKSNKPSGGGGTGNLSFSVRST